MAFCPGLVGDAVTAASFRAFLGAPPQLAVEKRLLRHMHNTVGAWFLGRRRIREGANEFLEFDGAACDTDIMLRHCQIYFLRRQLFNEVLDKQVAVIEGGKPPREPEPEVLACLSDINEALTPRYHYERARLEAVKAATASTSSSASASAHAPSGRRELRPADPLERWDVLCMMRHLEQDMAIERALGTGVFASSDAATGNQSSSSSSSSSSSGGSGGGGGGGGGGNQSGNKSSDDAKHVRAVVELAASAEAQAKAFLPLGAVNESAEKLAQLFARVGSAVGGSADSFIPKKIAFDPKDQKLAIKTFVPGDYQKTGCGTPRLRPSDATSLFRFYGERVMTLHGAEHKKDPAYFFRRALWGHVFRRFATHPAFLSSSVSHYWAARKDAGSLHPAPPVLKMPMSVAEVVCMQQADVCQATKLRTQYLYTHHGNSKQSWRSELVFPSLRLLSATGQQSAEDMLGGVLVDAFFNVELASPVKSAAELTDDKTMRKIVQFVNEAVASRTSSVDALLQRAQSAAKVAVPPLSEAEQHWAADNSEKSSATAPADGEQPQEQPVDGAEDSASTIEQVRAAAEASA